MDIDAAIEQLEGAKDLWEPTELGARLDALDQLDWLRQVGRNTPGGAARMDRIRDLQRRLRRANADLAACWLHDLLNGPRSREALREAMAPYSAYGAHTRGHLHLRIEPLDALLFDLLQIERTPAPSLRLDREMVHLEHTPTSVLLELVDTVPLGPDDLFVDLGSGLGQVAIWLHLLTGAPTLGIERDPALADWARQQALRVRAAGARFLCADVRQADLSAGSVFYLFTPFTGALLDAVLQQLHAVAACKPITVCSYGPCTPQIGKQPWLEPIDAHCDHDFKLAVWKSRLTREGL